MGKYIYIGNVGVYVATATEDTLNMSVGMSDTSGGRISPNMSDFFGQQTGPSIFQGMKWVKM